MKINESILNIRAYTLYWDNVDPRIVNAHRLVFAHFGILPTYTAQEGLGHGEWMNRVMEAAPVDQIVLFCDVDAIPLRSKTLVEASSVAEMGGIYGCAQTGNHLADSGFVYAGPMFLALKKRTWVDLGKPSFEDDDQMDVAMRVSAVANVRELHVELLYPNVVCVPKWQLGQTGVFGVGTFYQGRVFHLFEARKSAAYVDLFRYVADSTALDSSINYLHAISLASRKGVRIRNISDGMFRGIRTYAHALRSRARIW